MSSDVSRREFIAKLGGTGLMVPALVRSVSAQTPAAPTNLRIEPNGPSVGGANKALLTPADFTPLGHYDIQTNGSNTTYVSGLTHRYVGGDLRFLNLQVNGQLHEISLAGQSYGSVISAPTRSWSTIGGLKDFTGFWWDEAASRLWTVAATDYTASVVPVQIFTRTLNDSGGGVSNLRGPVGLQGINAKRVYGGVQPVPAWFRSRYGVGPYVVGWGGYTSLLAQGGGASLGPAMYAIPDPAGYANNTEVPLGAFKTIMDSSAASSSGDWYAAGSPGSYDRGTRVTRPINYFDGGDLRQNPSSPPTVGPAPGAQWLAPAPDGLGRFVWGDSYYNTGQWIEGPNKQGFIMVASLGGGKCWYQTSTLHYDNRVFELHIFDPARLGEGASGSRPAWNVRPSSMTQLALSGMGKAWEGNTVVGNVAGATYDPLTQRLYILGTAVNTFFSRLYVYQVHA